MKKSKFLSILMLILMTIPSMVACGGDDDDNGGQKNAEGVIVSNGKKLSGLDLQFFEKYKGLYVYRLRIDYDTKGRLSKVLLTNMYHSFSKEDGVDWDYFDNNNTKLENDNEILKIDYDFNLIKLSNVYDLIFSLNEKGYIHQIGDCICSYDSNGYLSGVKNNNCIWTLAYSEGELIKSLVNNLVKDNMDLYYVNYGEDRDKGEIVFYMDTSNAPNSRYDIGNVDVQGVMCFIAYQAGLFGKITNYCTNLSRSKENLARLEKKNENTNKKLEVRCKFVFEESK